MPITCPTLLLVPIRTNQPLQPYLVANKKASQKHAERISASKQHHGILMDTKRGHRTRVVR